MSKTAGGGAGASYSAVSRLQCRAVPCPLACGTRARRERRSYRPMLAMSRPSMTMRPLLGSTMRNSVSSRVDLPHPVRPAMPTWRAAQCHTRWGGGVRCGVCAYVGCRAYHLETHTFSRARTQKLMPFSTGSNSGR